ncbi:MAG: LacI family DNA-binding transcriptional regulator [Phycisphaerae bacterium]|nr:LacI family DNA-binding transcriptional regulator [Phycisphaerae bacterium]
MSTVSMALSDHPNISKKTKKDVIRISRELGYTPRRERMRVRPLPGVRCGLKRIGFFLIGNIHHHEVYPTIVNTMAANISSQGMRFEMASLEPDKADDACEKVSSFAKGVDGLIVTGYVKENLLDWLESCSIPYVAIGHYQHKESNVSKIKGNIVDYDYLTMGKIAVEYLVKQGHRRIGFVCETLPEGLYYSLWLEGYRLGLANHSLPAEADWIHVAGKDFAGGEPAADAFLAQANPPTAYLVPEARTARSFIHAIEMRGNPIDSRNIVVGSTRELIDKYHLGNYPLITTSGERLAMAAVRQLIQIFESPLPFPTQLTVPFALINMFEPDKPVSADIHMSK